MIERFKGESGSRLLAAAVAENRIVGGDTNLADTLVARGNLVEFQTGQMMVKEGSADNDLYLIITGSFDVVVKGTKVATRGPGEIVGESAAINPAQTRTATLVCVDSSVALKISEVEFSKTADEFPRIWRYLAVDLARRLNERNSLVSKANDRPHVFIICSVEALEIAQEIQLGLSHSGFLVTLWTNGVFMASGYPLESLEAALEAADFAVAIAHPDDKTVVRGKSKHTPRDNVIFELGFFMGRLGRKRTFLLEPRGGQVKLPSDLSGLNTIGYRTGTPGEQAALMAPTCIELNKLFKEMGPR
ncbi:cyclic nucleotide-binding domain-containing protein [Rhizobium ruizarguesonis]|uniref:TIR domain-containing protein n=1 Tax=Rhizobium ruizarguesonis TaxID=2081791 RepID=UPI00103239C5|nr:TIR domain-containing protein [Rhizobium ruizarguesonis]TAZ95939.1 cyclic nucleotide-binding domain-containing protein [Rhizobium ruizarguesonis]